MGGDCGKCAALWRFLQKTIAGAIINPYLLFRHLSLQYFTSSQTFSHFFRQVKGRLQTTHILTGKFSFFTFFIG